MDEITDKHIDEGWFDIARPGKWEGSQGGEHETVTVTREDLEQMAADYSPEIQEAPIKFDHGTGPAYGWIDKLRIAGDKLQAKLGHVSAELRQALKNGSYRSRSIEMYKPHTSTGRAYLGGLAFLGAKPPAVKGLSPVPQLFTEGAANSLVWFYEPDEIPIESGPSTEEEFLMDDKQKKEVTELAESAAKKGVKETLKEMFGFGDRDGVGGALADVKVELAETKHRAAELEGQLAAEKKRADEAQAKLDEHEKAAELSEFQAKLEEAKKAGKITPAEETRYLELGEKLDAAGRKTLLEQVAASEKTSLLSEHAKAGGDGGSTGRCFGERQILAQIIQAQGGVETDAHRHTRVCYDLMEAPGNEKMTFSEASDRVHLTERS